MVVPIEFTAASEAQAPPPRTEANAPVSRDKAEKSAAEAGNNDSGRRERSTDTKNDGDGTATGAQNASTAATSARSLRQTRIRGTQEQPEENAGDRKHGRGREAASQGIQMLCLDHITWGAFIQRAFEGFFCRRASFFISRSCC